MSLLELKNLSFEYPQATKKAINNISFNIEEGEYIAIVGSNGSGKSTLARLLAQFLEPSEGTLTIKDNIIPGIVFQQPKEQIVAGIVERDTAFGPQNLNMTKGEIELRTMECLSVTGLVDRASSRTFELSLGQTQRLAFSGILALFPDLLILDEVTAMLDPDSRSEIIEFVDQWHKKGHGIIHITHDYDEALHADRVIVMDKGNLVFDGNTQDFVNNSEIKLSVFGDFSEVYNSPKLSAQELLERETVLKVENLTFNYPDLKIFNNVSFSLKKGSITAITGPSGCGKSTMLECLAGLQSPLSGKIKAISRPSLALQESEAALFESYAADDVAFGPKNKGVKGKALVKCVKKSMELAGIPYKEFANRQTFALSGGEKRKLSLAGIIALDSDILMFDEPTAGLDPESRKTVLMSMRRLADEGKTILFSTHRMEEAEMADVRLSWGSLNIEDNQDNESLKELLPVENASMLRRLNATSAAFMAPPKGNDSFIRKMPAVVKYLVLLSLFVLSVFSRNIPMCFLTLGVSFIYSLLAKQSLKRPLKAFVKILPWFIVFAVIQLLFFRVRPTDVILFEYGFIHLTEYTINNVCCMLIRAVAIITIISTFIYTTDERQILDGLTDLLKPLALIKVPIRYFVLVVGIIFRFIPLLLDETSGIIKTQIVRGAFGKVKGFGKIKIMLPLFVPMMLQTFRKAQSLADALTARYFS